MDEIEHKSHIIVFCIAGILSFVIIFNFVKHFKSIDEIPVLIMNIIGISIWLLLVMTPFVQYGIYILNGLKTSDIVNKGFVINDFDSRGYLTFYDLESKELLTHEKCFEIKGNSAIKSRDTVYFSFNKGLLGFTHQPVLISKQ